MVIKKEMSTFIFGISLLLTGCGENNSTSRSLMVDNNIGSVQKSTQEQVIFNKKSVISASKIAGLYVAYFDRAPDLEGLNYWKNNANLVGSKTTLKELSAIFATHPIFISTYNSMSNSEFVEAIYKNVLNKAGDEEGIAYWTNYLGDGKSRSDMVSDFVETSLKEEVIRENFPNLESKMLKTAQERQDFITNKVGVALNFTTLLGTQTNVADNQHPESDPAYLASIKILDDVTSDSTSVSTAIDFLNSIKNDDDPIGKINRDEPANQNEEVTNKAPTANAGADKTVTVNETITLSGSGTDTDGTIVSYEWKKGSEVLGTDATLDYIPTVVGTDTLTLTVTDDDGAVGSDSVKVIVKNNDNIREIN